MNVGDTTEAVTPQAATPPPKCSAVSAKAGELNEIVGNPTKINKINKRYNKPFIRIKTPIEPNLKDLPSGPVSAATEHLLATTFGVDLG